MPALTSSVAASLVVPFVLQGELQGRLFEGDCVAQTPRTTVGGLVEVGRGPDQLDPVILSPGDVFAPHPVGMAAVELGLGEPFGQALRRDDGAPIFDALVVGNLELSMRPEALARVTSAARLPWTVANLRPPMDVARERIVDRGPVRVGITAVIDDQLADRLHPSVAKMSLATAAPALEASVRRLRAAGAHVVVAVLHVGETDGHAAVFRILTNLGEDKPDLVFTSGLKRAVGRFRLAGGRTVVLPAPVGPDRAQVARMGFDRRGMPVFRDNRVVEVPARPRTGLETLKTQVCEVLDTPLWPEPFARPVDEAAFSTFVLQKMRETAGAEIAIVNKGAFGGTYPIEALRTRLDLDAHLPFSESLRVAELRGNELAPILAAARHSNAVALGAAPTRVAGREIEARRRYRVVTVDFVARGGDGILDPEKVEFTPLDAPPLRDLVAEAIRARGMAMVADGAAAVEVVQPTLLGLQVNLSGNLKAVAVSNDASYEAPQLTRDDFLGGSLVFDLRLTADFELHRFDLQERTRFGVAQDGSSDFQETDDVTRVELSYIGRFAGRRTGTFIPDASAAASLETELTVPGIEEGRGYRRALGEFGVGPSWPIDELITFRTQLGLRRELLADGDSADEAEADLAQLKLAVLSLVELRPWVLKTDAGGQLRMSGRLEHTVDLTGTLRDNILKGRLDVDVPLTRNLAVTAGVEVYLLDRSRPGPNDPLGLSWDTTFGLKATDDFSAVVY